MAKSNEEGVRREVDRVLQELAVHEQEAQEQGLIFTSVSEETLTNTIQQGAPVATAGYAINPVSVRRGQTATHSLYLQNLDSVDHHPCFLSIFIDTGAAFMPDIEWALLSGRDAQWPVRTSDDWVSLPAGGGIVIASVPYTVPANARLGSHRPHLVCWQLDLLGMGSVVLARAAASLFEVIP